MTVYYPSMRNGISIALNIIVPGTGLVLVKRERWGVAFAFLFCALGQIALFGGWITPASIPRPMTYLAMVGATGIWVAAQGLLWSRLSALKDPSLSDQKSTLIELAIDAIEDGIYVNARLALESALALDDEDILANVLWARLMTLMGRFPEARRAWKRVALLDPSGEFGSEAAEVLGQLPSEK